MAAEALPPHFLVFAGGGLHGLSYVGSLIGLQESGALDLGAVRGCIGTSVGSVLALAVCLGVSPARMSALVAQEVEWSRLHPGVNVHSVLEKYGLDTRSGLEYLVGLLLTEAGIHPTATLRAVFALTKRHFACTVCDLTHSKLRYLDHLTAPDLDVLTAVTASMCVPILYEPVRIDGALCVDGGLIENLPVGFFPAERSFTLRFATADEPQAIDGWQDYVSAVLHAGHRAKEDRDVQTLRAQGDARMLAIALPSHMPSALELKRINGRLASALVCVGYLQAATGVEQLCTAVGGAVGAIVRLAGQRH